MTGRKKKHLAVRNNPKSYITGSNNIDPLTICLMSHFVDSFATGWEAWYTHIQPNWCITHTVDNIIPTISLNWDPLEDAILLDWSKLKKGSQNRFYLLLLILG